MNDDMKSQQGTDDNTADDTTLMGRRDFLRSLDKWSKVVIGSALFGGAMLKLGAVPDAEAGAWANRAGGGGAWANRAGGGGSSPLLAQRSLRVLGRPASRSRDLQEVGSAPTHGAGLFVAPT